MVSWLMTIKAVLISSGVASVGLLLKLSVPVAVDFALSQAPIIWSSLLSWLKPPYLYVLTNGIIITIVASSKYYQSTGHHEQEDDGIVYSDSDYKIHTEPLVHDSASPRMLEVKDLDSDEQFDFVGTDPPSPQLEPEVVTYEDEEVAEEEKTVDVMTMVEDETESEFKTVIMVENSDLVESCGDDDVMLLPRDNSSRTNLPPRITETENLPPRDSRFRRRKSVNASEEGGRAVLRVRKPKQNDTLENTWKMITEGKSTPLTNQLYRRSDTFSRGDSGGSGEANPVYKRSATFRDMTNYHRSPVRKEASLSQDELNRRVEAFIKKFNEDMKLQRMESLKQYKKITGHGV